MKKPGVGHTEILKVAGSTVESGPDLLVTEEPLEIRIGYGPETERLQKNISVTMRTPGQDLELAAGFLFTERIIQSIGEIKSIDHCFNVSLPEEVGNVVKAELMPLVSPKIELLDRHFYTSSSCGVCGKTSIEAVKAQGCNIFDLQTGPFIQAGLFHKLPDVLSKSQTVFLHTGGLHAAALFDKTGNLITVREDVGRHNAVDKVIGERLFSPASQSNTISKNKIDSNSEANTLERGNLFDEKILFVSGRAGFELVQKAIVAGIPIMAAVGAPSSLAVELARAHNMTLIGFLRDNRFNIYAGKERILGIG